MAYELGSTWRKWDLHVHTPESHTAHYGGDWDRFFSDIESLPSEIAVLGISDYMWVDGYKRVLEAKATGRLPRIETIFPVIELRLHDFIGTTSHLARVNAHVIFAADTAPDLITNQFLSRLVAGFKLSDDYQHLKSKWDAVPTREAVTELGRMIKESIPEDQLEQYGSDLVEGFNNWVITLAAVIQALEDSSFSETPLLALGKTEWADIPWSDNTIAAKKNLISEAKLIFTAASSPGSCQTSVKRLKKAGVNHRLLDCSDAHDFSTSTDKDRLGNCHTWVCADPTLAGLKHALFEYDARVFIGDKPPLLLRQETDPTNFISRVRINPVDPGTAPPPSFDVELAVNGGFVAVIGNKGSGKSALLDSLALAANSHSEAHFTFLSEVRYRSPRNNKAPHYQVEITTADGQIVGPLALSQNSDLDAPERIRYLPQSLLDKLCNKEPGSPDDAFEAELRSIIFSHVPDHQRLGCKSLDELLHRRGEALERDIKHRRAQLSELNKTIADLENQARPSRLESLTASLKAINQQLKNHDSARPPDPALPAVDDKDSATLTEMEGIRSELTTLSEKESDHKNEYSLHRSRLDAANNLLREFQVMESEFDDFTERASHLAKECGLDIKQLAKLVVQIAPVEEVQGESITKIEALDKLLGAEGEINTSRLALQRQLNEKQSLLDEPRRQYEEQRQAVAAWAEARVGLVGKETEPGTKQFLEAQISEASSIPSNLDELRLARMDLAKQIHGLLLEKVHMYRELYQPVQDFLHSNQLAREKFSLEFEANLEIKDFATRFLSYIDRSVTGSFYGIDASSQRVRKKVRSVRPPDWDSTASFLTDHEGDLRFDRRERTSPAAMDSPSDQLRKSVTLEEVYNFLFGLSYLEAEYELKSDGRSISELSPGQKGTILLMFYLLVDKSGRPIALDQPDENLDNHTVHTLLRPAIRSAKRNRQVFVVTHSPNLAVVGDADQVIVATNERDQFIYQTGSIENPKIRDLVVKVLEGTWPAFSDRNRKYLTTSFDEPQPELSD